MNSEIDVTKILTKENIPNDIKAMKKKGFHFVDSGQRGEGVVVTQKARVGNYTRDRIRELVSSPSTNYTQLQEISEHLYHSNTHYFRIVRYFSNLMRFDHYIYGTDSSKIPNLKDYQKAASLVDSFQIRRQFPMIIRELILFGEVYLYKMPIKGTDRINLVVIPRHACEVDRVVEGIYRYIIRPQRMSDEEINSVPPDLLKGWSKESNTEEDFIEVDENGVAFILDGMGRKGFPMLSFMFDSILALVETKDKEEIRDELDTMQIIHQMIPLRDNRQETALNLVDIAKYHRAMSRHMPEGVTTVTTPLEVSSIKMDRPKDTDIDKIKRAEREVWNSSGSSDVLFSTDKTSAESLMQAIRVDELIVKPIVSMLENYLKWEMKKEKFSVKILSTTIFNHQEKIAMYKEGITFGGSRLDYLAALGYDPIEIIPKLKFEQDILNIDELMAPKPMSYTLSNKDDKSGVQKVDETKGTEEDKVVEEDKTKTETETKIDEESTTDNDSDGGESENEEI